MSSMESSSTSFTTDRLPSTPIRPRVFHIVSPLTGSKATIITTDTSSSPNSAPVLIQAAQRFHRVSINPRKRPCPFPQESEPTTFFAAQRHRERLSKGLRYFSKKVCNKVQTKKITSYNEVATELVTEYTMEEKRNLQLNENELAYEQKNIRRRVYDAINVLLAMNIIVKDKKDIRWVGFPVNALFECELIEKKILTVKEEIREKIQLMEDALLKQIALLNLIRRNEKRGEIPPIDRICHLPFFTLNTTNGATIKSAFSRDGRQTIVTIDRRVKLRDETECLHRLGFSKELRGEISRRDDLERIRTVFPPVFAEFVTEMATNGSLKSFAEKRKSSSGTKSNVMLFPASSSLKIDDEPVEMEDEDDEEVDDEDEEEILFLSSGAEDEEDSVRR